MQESYGLAMRLNRRGETILSDIFLSNPIVWDDETGRVAHPYWANLWDGSERTELQIFTDNCATLFHNGARVYTWEWRHCADRTRLEFTFNGVEWQLEYWTPGAPRDPAVGQLDRIEAGLTILTDAYAQWIHPTGEQYRVVAHPRQLEHAPAAEMRGIIEAAVRLMHGKFADDEGRTYAAQIIEPDNDDPAGTPPELMVTVNDRDYILTISPRYDETGTEQ